MVSKAGHGMYSAHRLKSANSRDAMTDIKPMAEKKNRNLNYDADFGSIYSD
jgi:hypothetical protein